MPIFTYKYAYLARTLAVYLNMLSALFKTFCAGIINSNKLCRIKLGIRINKVNSVSFEFMLTLNILILLYAVTGRRKYHANKMQRLVLKYHRITCGLSNEFTSETFCTYLSLVCIKFNGDCVLLAFN